MTDPTIGTLDPATDRAGLAQVRDLLAGRGLGLDPDVEVFVTARDQGRLVGCMGLAGAVVKCTAVAAQEQGHGLAARLMTRLNDEAMDRGHATLRLFTTTCNRATFEALGFTAVAATPRVVMMESSPFALATYRRGLQRTGAGGRVAALVLTADPFTAQDRRLVQAAAELADAVQVFVPEARLPQVRAQVDLLPAADRIVLNPGSRYVVPRLDVPGYFLPGAADRQEAGAGLSLQLFRVAIAPHLGITDYVVAAPDSAPDSAPDPAPDLAPDPAAALPARRWLAADTMPHPSPLPGHAPALTVHEIPGPRPTTASRPRTSVHPLTTRPTGHRMELSCE